MVHFPSKFESERLHYEDNSRERGAAKWTSCTKHAPHCQNFEKENIFLNTWLETVKWKRTLLYNWAGKMWRDVFSNAHLSDVTIFRKIFSVQRTRPIVESERTRSFTAENEPDDLMFLIE